MGPNGSGKTTLFEMLSGSNMPTSGKVLCAGQDVHRVKYRERDRMVIHYHQSYQVRASRRPCRASCSSRRAPTTRWFTSSTSRSSARKTATSASC